MKNGTEKFSEMLKECQNIVFFGGAGMSTASGVKDYRSEDGLYNTVKEYGVSPEVILSRSFFFAKPEIFYDFYRKYFITDASPNIGHTALAELERLGRLKAVITQNIDGLHTKAGSRNVIELHGNAEKFSCSKCKMDADSLSVISEIKNGSVPLCKHCGGIIKPKVVLYEEPLYDGVAEEAVRYISNADMLIVGGTSLAVYPAASFVDFFKGRYIVIINKSQTHLDSRADLVICDSIGDVLDFAVKELVI